MSNLPPLPDGWEEKFDPTQNRPFYIDHVNKRTQWERPQANPAPSNFGLQPVQQQPQFPQVQTWVPPAGQAQSNLAPGGQQQPVRQPSFGQQYPVQYQQPGQPQYQQPQMPMQQPPQQQQPAQQQQHMGVMGGQQRMAPVAGDSVIGGQRPNPPPSNPAGPVGSLGSVMSVKQAPLSLSEPTWDTKQTGFGCSNCGKEFTFLNRRHRCRCCFREYCGTCSVKNIAVPRFGHTTPVRVCDACHGHLSTNRQRCLSRLVPYFERDNVPDNRKMEALGEAYEMLTSGMEILEDSKNCGVYSPLLHVVETAGVEKSDLTAKALAILGLLTDLDNTNCACVIAVPDSIAKLVGVVTAGNAQTRMLAAEIVCALSRNKEAIDGIVEAGYLMPCVVVLSGQYGDSKLLDVCAETLSSLAKESEAVRNQIQESPEAVVNILGSLVNSSLASQRFLIDVLSFLSPASILRAQGAAVLVPLLKTHTQPTLINILNRMVSQDGGPIALLDAGILKQLYPDEPDPMLSCISLLEKESHEQLCFALFPVISQRPEAAKKMCETAQVGRLTSLLQKHHFSEDVKLLVLRVMADLCLSEEAVIQIVDTGGLYDLVNHIAGASVSLQTAYLSVLQGMFRHKYCVSKASDAGAIQALVPMALSQGSPVISQMALFCLDTICAEEEGDAKILVVAVATPASVVSNFLQEAEGLRLVKKLLQHPETNKDLMEAGIFNALLFLISAGPTKESRSLAASALALCIQQNTTVDPNYIAAISDLMDNNGPEVGVELLAAFSAQPVYRQFILQKNLVGPLVALLLSGSPDSLRHAVLALANMAYDDEGSGAILQQGGISVLVSLVNHEVDQVQGCALLALGNLCRTPACRTEVVRDGGAETIMEKFSRDDNSPAVENYCLWALRMLAVEPGVPEKLAGASSLSAVFRKLAHHISHNPDSKAHALSFCNIMCGVPAFCMALASFPQKQDLILTMLIEPGPGREWAMKEVTTIPIGMLVQVPVFSNSINALLSSNAPNDQRAGINLCVLSLSAFPENLALINIPLIVRLLPHSSKVMSLVCVTAAGRALVRDSGAISQLVELMFNGNVDAVEAISMLCKDAENAPFLVQSGVVTRFAMSSDSASMEALSYLIAYPECLVVLSNIQEFVPDRLLPLLTQNPESSHLLAILVAILKHRPLERRCAGICKVLLMNPNSNSEIVVDALSLLPPDDLFAEGAFERAVELFTNVENSIVIRNKALLILRKLSVKSWVQLTELPDFVPNLLPFANSSAGLSVLHIVLRKKCEEFLSLDGVGAVIKSNKPECVAEAVDLFLTVVNSSAFDVTEKHVKEAEEIIAFVAKTCCSDLPLGSQHIQGLQILRELYFSEHCKDKIRPIFQDPLFLRNVGKFEAFRSTFEMFFRREIVTK